MESCQRSARVFDCDPPTRIAGDRSTRPVGCRIDLPIITLEENSDAELFAIDCIELSHTGIHGVRRVE
jgi:hypothetical protein